MEFSIKWAGLIEYVDSLQLQQNLIQILKNHENQNFYGFIIGLQHPSVITLGVRGQMEKDVLQIPSGVEVVKTNRGGEATFHNPGQLVIYPVLNLRKLNLGVKAYVDLLLLATQKFLLSYGIESKAGFEPGLYTDRGKIVAVGIKISQGISSHGIAINVCNETSLSKNILVCGVKGQPVSKMFDAAVNLEEIFACWGQTFMNLLKEV